LMTTQYAMLDETRDKRITTIVANSVKREEACYERIGDKIWKICSFVVKRGSDAGGDLPLTVHIPKDSNASPGMVVLCLRGCGGVWGDVKDPNIIERWEVFHRETKTAPCFISVGYRRAMDAKFPSQVQDAIAAYDALQTPELQEILGFAPAKVGLMGISMGGLFAAHAAVELAKEGKPLHFLAMHTPMICPFLLGPDALDVKKCAALNTLGGQVAHFCFMYLVGPHTEFRLRYVPTEEEFKSLSLLHAVDWATVKDLPVLFITAAKDFHSAHAHNDKLEVLLKEKGVNFTRVDCEGFHALPEKLDVDKEDTEKIAVINTWYQKTFGGGVAPPSKM